MGERKYNQAIYFFNHVSFLWRNKFPFHDINIAAICPQTEQIMVHGIVLQYLSKSLKRTCAAPRIHKEQKARESHAKGHWELSALF